jgi:murein DD-endopeptidase MepM/ murein hydrolase activator NlpD
MNASQRSLKHRGSLIAFSVIGLVQAWAALAAPASDGFDFPFNPPDGGGGWWIAQDKGVHNRRFGGCHTGEDWNWGSGSQDLGKPIFASAHGKVVLAAWCGDGWRHVVVVRHRLPGGSQVESKYAHLRKLRVRDGQDVKRGQRIGEIGPAPAGSTAPHLHWEIRKAIGIGCGPGYTSRERCDEMWYDPSNFVAGHRPGRRGGAARVPRESDEGLMRQVGAWAGRHPLRARFGLAACLAVASLAVLAYAGRKHREELEEDSTEGEEPNEQ